MRAATNPIVLAAPDPHAAAATGSPPRSVADRLTISNRLCGRNRRGAAVRPPARRPLAHVRTMARSLFRLASPQLRRARPRSRTPRLPPRRLWRGAARGGGAAGGCGAARRALRRPPAHFLQGRVREPFPRQPGLRFRRVFLRFTRFGAPALTSTFGGFGRRLLNWLFYWERRSLDDILDRNVRLQPSRRVRRLRLDVAAKRKIRLWRPPRPAVARLRSPAEIARSGPSPQGHRPAAAAHSPRSPNLRGRRRGRACAGVCACVGYRPRFRFRPHAVRRLRRRSPRPGRSRPGSGRR